MHVMYVSRLSCGHYYVVSSHPGNRLYGRKSCGQYCQPVTYYAIYPARVPDYPVLIWH